MKRGTPDHPKTLALAKALQTSKAETVGLLELLWHWTARYAPRGDVGRWSDGDIASGAAWEGDPGEFVRALAGAGWLDASEEHRLVVHDWHQHADDTTKRALKRRGEDFVTDVGPCPDTSRTCPDVVQTCLDTDPHPPDPCPDMSGLPEPEPEPQPVPEPQPQPAPGADAAAAGPPGSRRPRDSLLECPDCKARTVIRRRPDFGEGWVCWPREGGCGQQFAVGEPTLLSQLSAGQIRALRRGLKRSEQSRASPPASPEAPPPEPEAEAAWKSALTKLAEGLDRQAFRTWFQPTQGQRFADGKLLVSVPSEQFQSWLMERYGQEISEAMTAAGVKVELELVLDGGG